jgi:hypothetical protein
MDKIPESVAVVATVAMGGGSKKEARDAGPYSAAFNRLRASCPDEVPVSRWRACLDDAGRFLASWENCASALGWTEDDLFGLDAAAPMARYDKQGLLWILQGARVTAITVSLARLSTGHSCRRPSCSGTGE